MSSRRRIIQRARPADNSELTQHRRRRRRLGRAALLQGLLAAAHQRRRVLPALLVLACGAWGVVMVVRIRFTLTERGAKSAFCPAGAEATCPPSPRTPAKQKRRPHAAAAAAAAAARGAMRRTTHLLAHAVAQQRRQSLPAALARAAPRLEGHVERLCKLVVPLKLHAVAVAGEEARLRAFRGAVPIFLVASTPTAALLALPHRSRYMTDLQSFYFG